MDELSLFKGANKEIIEQEKILLRKAYCFYRWKIIK
jgi:hypothetical protein